MEILKFLSLKDKNKKGLTPIVAIILLLMMTVAAAGAAFFWISRIQGQLQGGVESYQGRVFEGMASQINVIDADYGTGNENLTLFLHNIGNRKIALRNSATSPTTTWILRDPDQAVVCSTDWSGTGKAVSCSGCGADVKVDVGQLKSVSIATANTDCDITKYGGGKAFTFTIDFSGELTTSGSFVS